MREFTKDVVSAFIASALIVIAVAALVIAVGKGYSEVEAADCPPPEVTTGRNQVRQCIGTRDEYLREKCCNPAARIVCPNGVGRYSWVLANLPAPNAKHVKPAPLCSADGNLLGFDGGGDCCLGSLGQPR